MPFRGVRISWLIFARNWLLAWLAALRDAVRNRQTAGQYEGNEERDREHTERSREHSLVEPRLAGGEDRADLGAHVGVPAKVEVGDSAIRGHPADFLTQHLGGRVRRGIGFG